MIKPQFNYIVLTEVVEEVSRGGIVLVKNDNTQESCLVGVIKAVGPKCIYQYPEECKVLFDNYKSIQTRYNDQKLYIVKEEDVLAIL